MIIAIISILVGIIFGVFNGWMFLGAQNNEISTPNNFKRAVNSFFRLVFVIVAIILTIIYIDLSLILLLLGFMCAYWGIVLGNMRTRQ